MRTYQYWEYEGTVDRYSNMECRLFDVEKVFLARAVELLGKNATKIRVLDLGCGGGRTTLPLGLHGYSLVALDVSYPLVDSLKKTMPSVSVVCGDASSLPFDDGVFDIILFSHNSLDYVYPYSKRDAAYREIARTLNPGGFFIFSSHIFNPCVHDKRGLSILIRNLRRLPSLMRSGYYVEVHDGHDVITYSARNAGFVKNELQRHGFSLLRTSDLCEFDAGKVMSYLKALCSWERYYLCRKKS